MPKRGTAKDQTGARFSKLVLKIFGLKYISGLSLAHLLSKSVSQKARKCSELSSNILRICSVNSSSKVHSRGWAQLDNFFSGIKLNTYFTQEPSCLVFAMFPYPVINCQGLSNLLGLNWMFA